MKRFIMKGKDDFVATFWENDYSIFFSLCSFLVLGGTFVLDHVLGKLINEISPVLPL